MEKFFVDENGNYLGVFIGRIKNNNEIWPDFPNNGIEIPSPPQDGRQVWDFDTESWGAIPKDDLPTQALLQSPNGTPFKITVDDSGTISTQEVVEDA